MITTIKRILLILLLISSSVYAEEEILLEETPLFESGATVEEPIEAPLDSSVHHHTKFYDELYKNAHNVYNLQIENTNVPSCLLKEPLTHTFEKGPIESLHLWSVIQMNNSTNFDEGDTDNNFRVGLINALIDGKFRGGKEDFRIMLDPTPTHARGFFQQLYRIFTWKPTGYRIIRFW